MCKRWESRVNHGERLQEVTRTLIVQFNNNYLLLSNLSFDIPSRIELAGEPMLVVGLGKDF